MKFERGCVEGTKRWQRMGKKKYFFSLICDLAVLGGETLFAELLFSVAAIPSGFIYAPPPT